SDVCSSDLSARWGSTRCLRADRRRLSAPPSPTAGGTACAPSPVSLLRGATTVRLRRLRQRRTGGRRAAPLGRVRVRRSRLGALRWPRRPRQCLPDPAVFCGVQAGMGFCSLVLLVAAVHETAPLWCVILCV